MALLTAFVARLSHKEEFLFNREKAAQAGNNPPQGQLTVSRA